MTQLSINPYFKLNFMRNNPLQKGRKKLKRNLAISLLSGLFTQKEIAEWFGIKKQRVNQIIKATKKVLK